MKPSQENLRWVPIVQSSTAFPSQLNAFSNNTADIFKSFNVKWAYFIMPMILHCIVIITFSVLTVAFLMKKKTNNVNEQSARQCVKSSKRILLLNLGVIIQTISYITGMITLYITHLHMYHLTVNAVVIPIWISCYNPTVLLVGEMRN